MKAKKEVLPVVIRKGKSVSGRTVLVLDKEVAYSYRGRKFERFYKKGVLRQRPVF